MSVVYFSNEELETIYSNLTDIISRPDSFMEITEEKLLQFIIRVGLCNRLAYRYNYHEDGGKEIVLEIPELDTFCEKKLSLKRLIKKLGSLEYNCITNSGRCFCDEEDKKLLEKLIAVLGLQYVKILEQNLKT